MTKRRAPEETFTLVATIDSVDHTYYIADDAGHRRTRGEESLVLGGEITEISPRYKRHKGKRFEAALCCALGPSGLLSLLSLMSVILRI